MRKQKTLYRIYHKESGAYLGHVLAERAQQELGGKCYFYNGKRLVTVVNTTQVSIVIA